MVSSSTEVRLEVWPRPHFFHIKGTKYALYGPSSWNSVWARSEDFMKLRIVVADDNADFLSELISVLETEFDVVATAKDGKSALESIHSYCPDVVVLDLEMPLLNGIEVTRELVKQHPSPAIVICSVESDPEVVEAAQQAGALGYVFKSRVATDLVEAVKSVARGQSFISPA